MMKNRQPFYVKNNAEEENVWHGLDLLWEETTGDPNIRIAVLDGPVDQSHPCFDGAQLSQVETLVSGVADQEIASQHGTHIASVIFGQQGSPVQGIAPKCHGLIVPVYAAGNEGVPIPCSQIDLARAITQAVEEGAHIINISGGEFTPAGEHHYLLAQAVRLCRDKNVLIVAAAGNDGCACLHVPAAVPSVLAVGAMDAQGKPLEFSNWGSLYQTQGIVAPGENIVGAVSGKGTTTQKTGTSFATPIVSGIAALLLSIQLRRGDKKVDPSAVRAALLNSVQPCDLENVSDCERLLAGRLNIAGAYQSITKNQVAVSMLTPNQLTKREELIMSEQQTPEVEVQLAESNSLNSEDNTSSVSMSEVDSGKDLSVTESMEAPSSVNSLIETTAVENTSLVMPSQINPAACNGGCNGGKPSLVYALGRVGHDFGTEARRDSFIQSMGGGNPDDPAQLVEYLKLGDFWKSNFHAATRITWTLNIDATPIYAIQPVGAFNEVGYKQLLDFLSQQLNEGVERVSIPGFIAGKVALLSGQTVPVIVPELIGMASWSTAALVKAVVGGEEFAESEKAKKLTNFLDRIYYELRNLGVTSQERALNFAATNAFQVGHVFESCLQESLELDTIDVEPSPICRPGSDCWDVKLVFFNPKQRMERARDVHRFTIDVSDVIPVTVGTVKRWSVY
jgi:cyanobactin maturation PatA/PatG family protease